MQDFKMGRVYYLSILFSSGTETVEGDAYIPCLVHVLCMYVVRLLRSSKTIPLICNAQRVKTPNASCPVVPFCESQAEVP